MNNPHTVSRDDAVVLASAYGAVCKVRIADERTKQEALEALGSVHMLQGIQRELSIELILPRFLARLEAVLQEEAAKK